MKLCRGGVWDSFRQPASHRARNNGSVRDEASDEEEDEVDDDGNDDDNDDDDDAGTSSTQLAAPPPPSPLLHTVHYAIVQCLSHPRPVVLRPLRAVAAENKWLRNPRANRPRGAIEGATLARGGIKLLPRLFQAMISLPATRCDIGTSIVETRRIDAECFQGENSLFFFSFPFPTVSSSELRSNNPPRAPHARLREIYFAATGQLDFLERAVT